MITEFKNVRQTSDGVKRRWFCEDSLDIIVWYSIDDIAEGVQICMLTGVGEQAFTWLRDQGVAQSRVDSEKRSDYQTRSPILLHSVDFPVDTAERRILAGDHHLDPEIKAVLREALAACRDYLDKRHTPAATEAPR